MRKFLTIILSAIVVCFSFSSCALLSILKPKDLQLDKEYVYAGISFKKAEDIKIEDIDEFIPMFPAEVGSPSIKTVADFEKWLKDNLDEYTIVRHTENGNKRIALKPIKSIRITEGYPYIAHAFSLWIKTDIEGEEKELRYGAVCEENKFIPSDERIIADCFYFEKGALHYDFALNEKFTIVYNFELQ